jgi:hypothetical protein
MKIARKPIAKIRRENLDRNQMGSSLLADRKKIAITTRIIYGTARIKLKKVLPGMFGINEIASREKTA